jgi:hypothetical protein
MTENAMSDRARTRVAACKPASPLGRLLLERYVEAVDLTDPSELELVLLTHVCRLVEELPLDTISIRALDEAGEAPQPSKTARRLRRIAAGRLRRLLQATGELPGTRELAAEARIVRLLERAPAAGRGTLARWNEVRADIEPFERSHELRRLAQLEEVIAERGLLSDEALIQLWLRRLVRPIVACRCAPVTRAVDPNRCNACGATAESHGTRPSPAPPKQRRLERMGRRYLALRRLPVPTRSVA